MASDEANITPLPGIVRTYRNYTPPVDLTPTVQLLLRYVPAGYLAGLNYIELTNSTSTRALRRGKTRWRRKKVRMAECLGFYCGGHIQILVDNLLREIPSSMLRLPIMRAVMVGMVLYHEIGHHIHRTQQPAFREPENVADEWADRLTRAFLHRRYWYLKPIRRPMFFLIKTIYLLDADKSS